MATNENIRVAVVTGLVSTTTFISSQIQEASKYSQIFQVVNTTFENNKEISRLPLIKLTSRKKTELFKSFILLAYLLLQTDFRRKTIKFFKSDKDKSFASKLYLMLKHINLFRNNIHIIHIQWVTALIEYFYMQKYFNIPIVCSLRGSHITYKPITSEKIKKKYIDLFPLIRGFHSVSRTIKKKAIEYGAKEEFISVIYTGANFEKIDKLAINNHQKKRIISIGRNHWVKGYSYAIDAMKILRNSGYLFKYDLIGVEKDEPLVYQIHDHKLENEISLKNKLPHREVLNYIKHSDILLLPSVEEGIANVVIEAMSLGTLVVSSDCGGMNEVIENGENGYLFKKRDIHDMAEKLKKACNLTNDERKEIITNATTRIHQQFRKDVLGKKTHQLYIDTIERYKLTKEQ